MINYDKIKCLQALNISSKRKYKTTASSFIHMTLNLYLRGSLSSSSSLLSSHVSALSSTSSSSAQKLEALPTYKISLFFSGLADHGKWKDLVYVGVVWN